MDTNYKPIKSDYKYEKCWIKHIKVLNKCIDFTPTGIGRDPTGIGRDPTGIENKKLEICYEIFKKNYQECISYNSLYFNKIVK